MIRFPSIRASRLRPMTVGDVKKMVKSVAHLHDKDTYCISNQTFISLVCLWYNYIATFDRILYGALFSFKKILNFKRSFKTVS